MELRVLGPVELHVGDHWVDLGRRGRLALLVALGLAGGRPVPRETLQERISDDGGSKTAGTFNSYVSRVRNRLQSAGVRRNVLTERSGTYALVIDPDNVDWLRFGRLHSEARRIESSGDTDAALTKLDEARELWRGDPLTGLSGAWARGMREMMRRGEVTTTRWPPSPGSRARTCAAERALANNRAKRRPSVRWRNAAERAASPSGMSAGATPSERKRSRASSGSTASPG